MKKNLKEQVFRREVILFVKGLGCEVYPFERLGKGLSDLLIVPVGRMAVWVELKGDTGHKESTGQTDFMHKLQYKMKQTGFTITPNTFRWKETLAFWCGRLKETEL